MGWLVWRRCLLELELEQVSVVEPEITYRRCEGEVDFEVGVGVERAVELKVELPCSG